MTLQDGVPVAENWLTKNFHRGQLRVVLDDEKLCDGAKKRLKGMKTVMILQQVIFSLVRYISSVFETVGPFDVYDA